MLTISSGPLSCMDLHRRQLPLGGFARSSDIGEVSQ
jgi:hypothetical protein